jgi:hypothetical protein
VEFSYYRENLVTCFDARVLLQQEMGLKLRTIFSIDTFSQYWTIISPKLTINNLHLFIYQPPMTEMFLKVMCGSISCK